jgi:hypothetical protein
MSLLASASPWQNDSPAAPKKRVATMGLRKTVKMRSPGQEYDEYESTQTDVSTSDLGNSMADTQSKNEDTNIKVNTLLNKITGFTGANETNRLADFNPIPGPQMNVKKDLVSVGPKPEAPLPLLSNPLIPPPTTPTPSSEGKGFYKPISTGDYSNYSDVYPSKLTEPPGNTPYYAKMGIRAPGSSDKVLDKMNYMVHMLEEIQMEKTNHITEEFILYSLLGVFIIYLVDGFSRSGKYVR